MAETTFEIRFKALTGYKPFPWQVELFEKWFAKGEFPQSCNLATGLGKTLIIAIWLIALMDYPNKIPRRLVYIVNRRTVVDQTTAEVEKIRENLKSLLKQGKVPEHVDQLAISTLRGQFADNHEWSADPSKPAVICGTVDMIGSRLLFNGYGVGFKSKPLHAGFLGQDVLVVHDEAHLEPAFQELLTAIEKAQWKEERSQPMPWPKLRVLELTATSRQKESEEQKKKRFPLTDEEKNPPKVIPDPPTEPLHHVWQRIKAKKGIKFFPAKRAEVAERIGKLALDRKDSDKAIIIFVRTIADVETVRRVLTDKKQGVGTDQVQVLTGTQRGRERDYLVTKDRVFARFLHEPKVLPKEGTVYLICTSAGEVGVDMSGDHMVCDLTTLDSMAQRFGRVNRRGRAAAEIDIVYESDPDPKPKTPKFEKARWKTKEILERLPKCDWTAANDRLEASPLELGNLPLSDDERERAFASPPTILPTTDILFDAWTLTTISPPLVRTPLPGRPSVEPYLHGISEWQPPETYVAWRQEVEELHREFVDEEERAQFQELATELLEGYPLKPHELLRDRGDRVFKHLQSIADEYPDAPIWVVDTREQVFVHTLKKLAQGDKNAIEYKTVLLSPLVGGLNSGGMLADPDGRKKSRDSEEVDLNQSTKPDNAIQYDVADEWYDDKEPPQKRRIRLWDNEPNEGADGMALVREIRFEDPEDEDAGPIKLWRWYIKKPEVANERSKKALKLQSHLDDAKGCATYIVGRLLEPQSELAKAVILAAGCHDLGKNRERWQRSLGNDTYPDEVYAKSGKLPDGKAIRPREFLRDHYRHEFGSVLDLLDATHPRHAEFRELSPDMQDLVLHLIATHHGRARPHFPLEEAFDPEHNGQTATALAIETPRRFARLQRKYGRWGLAYIESLVRAADYFASAYPSENSSDSAKIEII